MRLALALEYDGSKYCGWQSQSNGRAVQDAVEKALSAMAGHSVRVACAGRTDAGVHAINQVIHFDTETQRPDTAWVRGVNALLPESVAILWVMQVSEEFHARFSATRRRYRYLLLNHPQRPALFSQYVGWFHQTLDINAMRACAKHLVGEHDFSAFRAAECQAKSPIKTLYQLEIRKEGDLVELEFVANGYLHHMVRNIVGSLVYVGKGKYPVNWIESLLVSKDRALCAPTFSATGLYLQEISYDDRWRFPNVGRVSFSMKAT